jgi:hypothetical protein
MVRKMVRDAYADMRDISRSELRRIIESLPDEVGFDDDDDDEELVLEDD